jgi:hypothetical protein
MMSYRQKLKDEIKAVGIAALYFGGWIAGLLFLKSLHTVPLKPACFIANLATGTFLKKPI